MFTIARQTAAQTRNSQLGRSAARSQLGMTLLEIMIVLAIIAVVMGFLVGPIVMEGMQKSKVSTTKMFVDKLAFEAYTQWTMETGENCPSSLKDLEKWSNKKGTKDSWGNELVMLCGENVPDGASGGFAILSKGADGKQGTEDDVKSWEAAPKGK